MNISGSVGFTLFKHNILNKYVLLFADVHDGVSYCVNKSMFIDKWLMTKGHNDILLEEVFRNYLSKLTELWPSSPHTQNLKYLSINNKKIKLVDIRPLLIPFSWELCDTDTELGSFLLKNYLETYDFLINYPEQTMRKKFVDYVNTYTAGATKIMVLTNYINEYAYTVGAHHIRIINDIGLSFMISLISYQNKCRIGEYSKVNIQEGDSYISCKIYNDNYYAYYDIAKRGPNNYNSYEHNYILNTIYCKK